jgi:hypothetical protein
LGLYVMEIAILVAFLFSLKLCIASKLVYN